jgi:hypothetical protein
MAFIPTIPFRGGIEVDDLAYVAFQDEAFTVRSDGEIKYLDDLAGSDRVFWARNQNSTPDVVVVCDAGAFELDVDAGTISAYSDSDVGTGANAPRGVTYGDGWFFFWYANGNIRASELNGTGINTIDVANAASNADGLVQCWPYNGQLYAGGEKTIEVWGYPVNSAGFPLNRVGYHITPGVISEHAVDGYQPEWGYPPIYVGSDNTVRWLQGYQATKISTPDLERLIASVEDKTDIKAIAYRVRGTAFWEVSCDDWTWVFNASNPSWFERQSVGQDRSRFEGGSVYAFGKWLVGDNQEGRLLEVTAEVQDEDGEALTATIISPSMKAFPNRVRCSRADFDFVVPAVTASTLPVAVSEVEISWSDDGGANFSNPYTRSLGTSTTDTLRRVTVFNTGYAKPIGRRWKLVSDTTGDFALLGGDMETEVRKK